MRVWREVGNGVCFSLFMVSACFWRGRLCFGRGRDRCFVLYISLFLRVLGWWVCVCLYTRVHTHRLLGYLMWAQVWDGHLESWKNPDRLKRSIHVDSIGVHSTFVYIYTGVRTLMIWTNCLFSFNMSFLLRKVEDVTTISKSQSLTSVSIKDCTLRVPNKTTTLFLLRVIIKTIFIHGELGTTIQEPLHSPEDGHMYGILLIRIAFCHVSTNLLLHCLFDVTMNMYVCFLC